MTDAEIILLSRENSAVFGEIVTRHQSAIHRYFWSRSPAAADDLMNETFLRAFRLIEVFDTSNESALRWLYGLSTNVLREFYRSERRVPKNIHLRSTAEDQFGRVEERQDAQKHHHELMLARSQIKDLDWKVLELYAIEAMSYQEIAEKLDIPLGTVRSRLFNARRRLRNHLERSDYSTQN